MIPFQPDLREAATMTWLVLAAALTAIFALFVVSRMHKPGWYEDTATQAAIALAVYFMGEAVARGWTVVLLYSLSHGGDGWSLEARFPIGLLGTIIAAIGGLCAVRIFTPEVFGRWRNAVWMGIAAMALIAGVVFANL